LFERRTAFWLPLLLLSTLASAAQQTVPAPAAAQTAPTQVATEHPPDEGAALADQLAAVVGEKESASATTNDSGPAGIIPATRGFNASLETQGQHDSAGGWSSELSPDVAYRFDRHFSFNVSVPFYTYINVVTTNTQKNAQGVVTETTSALSTKHNLLGDVAMAVGFDAHSRWLDYNLTVTGGAPTGSYGDGLGAGQYTYAFNNHFEKPLGDIITPDIELGIGNSSNLTDSLVHRSYIVVGTNAHFQAGLAVSLPFEIAFESDAFEDLPLSTQTITSTTTNGKKGKQLKTITTSRQQSIGEDNGFLNTLDIPLGGHVTLSGFYNRSLRNKIDTAGFSLTFLLRGRPRHE